MTRQDILKIFTQNVKKIMGSHLSKMLVYGSYARGDYKENSDIDVMILTTFSKKEIEEIQEKIFDLAFDLELESGLVINPVIENKDHFEYWLGALPFYNNVQREGVVIE